MQGLTLQVYAFCVTMLIGFLLGIFFDMYRVLRGVIRPRRIITHLGDLLFWFVSTGFIFLLLLFGNWGEIRLYVFIGIGLGALVYLHWCSRITVKLLFFILKILSYVLDIIITFLQYLVIILLFPLRILKKIIIVPIGFIGTAMNAGRKQLVRMLRRWFGYPLKKGWHRIKRRLRKIFHNF